MLMGAGYAADEATQDWTAASNCLPMFTAPQLSQQPSSLQAEGFPTSA